MAHRIHRVLANAFEHALVVERLLAVVERRLLQVELLVGCLRQDFIAAASRSVRR